MARKPTEHQQIGRALTDAFVTSINFGDKRRAYGDVVATAVRRAGGDSDAMQAAREHAAAILDDFELSDQGMTAAKRAGAEAAERITDQIAARLEQDRDEDHTDRDRDEVFNRVSERVSPRQRKLAADARAAARRAADPTPADPDRAAIFGAVTARSRDRRATLRREAGLLPATEMWAG